MQRMARASLGPLAIAIFLAGSVRAEETAPSKPSPPPPSRAAIQAELDRLSHAEEGIREEAFQKLSRFGKHAASLTAARLGDPDPEVRQLLAELLGEFRSPETVDPIARRLAKDDSVSVRRRLAQALGQIGGEAVLAPLTKQLDRESETAVLRDCLLALGRCGHPLAVDHILEFGEKSEDPYLKEIAAHALRQLTRQSLPLDLAVWRDWWRQRRTSVLRRFEQMQAEEAKRAEPE